MLKFINKNIRMAADDLPLFDQTFQESGCSSQGEFLKKLLDKWNQPEPIIEPEIRTVHLEKPILANQILLSLTPAQLFAIRGTVLSSENFAQDQNEIIDSLKDGNKPLMYFGCLFEPEFQLLWIRNIVLTKNMTPDQREEAIRHNMSAFLVNKFLFSLIDGKISSSRITVEVLKSFIKKQIEDSKPKPVKEVAQTL